MRVKLYYHNGMMITKEEKIKIMKRQKIFRMIYKDDNELIFKGIKLIWNKSDSEEKE